MEAVNHSKNSAMESENHVKNGRYLKSLMSRGNFLNMLCLSLLAAVFIFSGCDKDNGDDKNDGTEYLVTEISSEDEGRIIRTSFEYDEQNRITKIISYREWFDEEEPYTWTTTITYNNTNLVTVVDGDDDIITFTRSGNIVTVKASWWDDSDRVRSEIYEVNAQGLVVKYSSESTYEDGDWWKDVEIYEYQGRNLIKVTFESEEFWDGETREWSSTATLTYDDKKSPFYHSSTPHWFYFLDGLILYGVHNNMTSIDWGDGDEMTVAYTYNTNGSPATRIETERWWDDEDEVERVWEQTETFKYDTPFSQKSVLQAPNRSNISPNRDMRRDNWLSPRHRFGSNVENRR